MPTVRVPQPMQVYTNNKDVIVGQGRNLRQLISNLDSNYPGFEKALVTDGKLHPDIAFMIGGDITRLGLLQPLSENDEVIIIPAISGG